MPPKTFICPICGETVSRKKSYLYNRETGERACRKHEETQERRTQFIEEEQVRAEKEKANEERREYEKRTHQIGSPEWEQRRDEHANCCWKCLKKGLKHREFFMRQLVAMEKVSQREGGRPIVPIPLGEQGVRDCKKVRSAMKDLSSDKELLYIGQWPIPAEKLDKTLDSIRKRFRQVAEFLRVVQLCANCCEKVGYKIEDLMPKLTAEQFESQILLGHMLHKAHEPMIKIKAALEIAAENKKAIREN